MKPLHLLVATAVWSPALVSAETCDVPADFRPAAYSCRPERERAAQPERERNARHERERAGSTGNDGARSGSTVRGRPPSSSSEDVERRREFQLAQKRLAGALPDIASAASGAAYDRSARHGGGTRAEHPGLPLRRLRRPIWGRPRPCPSPTRPGPRVRD